MFLLETLLKDMCMCLQGELKCKSLVLQDKCNIEIFLALWSKVIQFSLFIMLCLGSIGMDQIVSEPYKGTVLQRNYRKMTISFQQ